MIAQTFTTHQGYSQVTGEVLLAAIVALGSQPATASFFIAADDNAKPGLALANANVTLTNVSPTVYALAFQHLELKDATTYWLVASSDAVGNNGSLGNPDYWGLPTWVSTPYDFAVAGPKADSLNSSPWHFYNNSEGFAMYGTPVSEPTPVPEPGALLLLAVGLVGLAGCCMEMRRKK